MISTQETNILSRSKISVTPFFFVLNSNNKACVSKPNSLEFIDFWVGLSPIVNHYTLRHTEK